MDTQTDDNPATLFEELKKGFRNGFLEGGKRFSKSDVEKNIWVPASLTLGITLGHITDVEKVAWMIVIGTGITMLWIAYYLVRKGLGGFDR